MYGVCVPRCKYADTNEDSILCMSCESNVNSRRNNDSMFFICKGERDVYRDGGRTDRLWIYDFMNCTVESLWVWWFCCFLSKARVVSVRGFCTEVAVYINTSPYFCEQTMWLERRPRWAGPVSGRGLDGVVSYYRNLWGTSCPADVMRSRFDLILGPGSSDRG